MHEVFWGHLMLRHSWATELNWTECWDSGRKGWKGRGACKVLLPTFKWFVGEADKEWSQVFYQQTHVAWTEVWRWAAVWSMGATLCCWSLLFLRLPQCKLEKEWKRSRKVDDEGGEIRKLVHERLVGQPKELWVFKDDRKHLEGFNQERVMIWFLV